MKDCIKNKEGNCQHIEYRSIRGLWIIPSGTHYFFGNIVSATSSFSFPVTKSPAGKPKGDDLAGDLQRLMQNCLEGETLNGDKLMQALSIYIVERDHKILQHGINLGKRSRVAAK